MKGAAAAWAAVALFASSALAGAQLPGTTPSGGSSSTGPASPVTSNAVNGKYIAQNMAGQPLAPRKEIRQLTHEEYSLYVLAMEDWQNEPQDPTSSSFYGLGGIHGMPHYLPSQYGNVNFNGVVNCGSQGCQASIGYCTHNMVLFPAWHRAYLALYEQQLTVRVKAKALQYPASVQAKMVAAAASFRLPYWDWAANPTNGQVIPNSLTDPQVSVLTPAFGEGPVRNSLAQFKFDSSPLYYQPFNSTEATFRYPSSNLSTAYSQNDQLQRALLGGQPSLQSQVYQLLTQCSQYLDFSNDLAFSSSSGCATSIEAIHNTVHGLTGGSGAGWVPGGHMTYLSLAGFDPIFFMHHANVDRIFALWQAVNPGSYGAGENVQDSTWTVDRGSYQDQNSPLKPFYKDDQNFWTTAEVENWNATFAYTYPEFQTGQSISAQVKTLYGGSSSGQSRRRDARNLVRPAETWEAEPILRSRTGAYANPLAATNGSTYEWAANIQTPRYHLNGSYTVYVFVGEPASEDPSTWISDAHLVGPFGVIADVEGTGMAEVVISGSLPLTRVLAGLVGQGLDTLSVAHAGPFLKAHLAWRVLGPEGCAVDPSSIPGFAVSVVSSTATVPTCADELPTFSDFITHANVTADIAGGLNATTKLLGDTFKGVEDMVSNVVGSLLGSGASDVTASASSNVTSTSSVETSSNGVVSDVTSSIGATLNAVANVAGSASTSMDMSASVDTSSSVSVSSY